MEKMNREECGCRNIYFSFILWRFAFLPTCYFLCLSVLCGETMPR